MDIARGTSSRFAGDPYASRPLWWPDGQRVMFSAVRDTPPNLFVQPLSGAEQRVLRLPNQTYAYDWSHDAGLLVFGTINRAARGDIWVLPVAEKGEPRPILNTRFNEISADVSPDGKWIAFTSDETGRNEVYVTTFPQPGRRIPISTAGGALPRWRGDGRELFYTAQRKLIAVAMSYAATAQPGETRELFELPEGNGFYVAAADGQRFLVPAVAETTATTAGTASRAVVAGTHPHDLDTPSA